MTVAMPLALRLAGAAGNLQNAPLRRHLGGGYGGYVADCV